MPEAYDLVSALRRGVERLEIELRQTIEPRNRFSVEKRLRKYKTELQKHEPSSEN